MSKRIMTNFKTYILALTMIFVVSTAFSEMTYSHQVDLLKSCMAVESNLPMNHSSHPCNATYMSNQSWWSWVSNDSKSAHLHFLDLIELMHHSFY